MRRLFQKSLFSYASTQLISTRLLSSAASSSSTTGDTGSGEVAASDSTTMAHPSIYNVPVLSTRTIGRHAEVISLWQNLLSGRRYQVLQGVDGIGKSSIAAEFCDCARRSQRFTCIQWFTDGPSLESQLTYFMSSMKGRREKDVLLVVDDVSNLSAILQALPEHPSLYVLMTCSNSSVETDDKKKLMAVRTPPLDHKAARELASVAEFDGEQDMEDMLRLLGNVPILVHVACALISSSSVTAAQLVEYLKKGKVVKDDTISVSDTLRILLALAVDELKKTFPSAKQQLAMLSCFHVSDISDALVEAVVQDEAGSARFSVMAAELGIFSLKWYDSSFAIHPTIARILREDVTVELASHAAQHLLSLWPRRWRGMGGTFAYSLVWHTYALSRQFTREHHAGWGAAANLLPEALATCMDRSAAFLVHFEKRDFPVAVQLWKEAYTHQVAAQAVTADTVRMAYECGRLLHYQRDPEAKEVLHKALQLSCNIHGRDALETCLTHGFLAPYQPASVAVIEGLTQSIAALEACLVSVDAVLSREEERMVLETVYVLIVCKGQAMTELGQEVSESLWKALDSVDVRLKKMDQLQG